MSRVSGIVRRTKRIAATRYGVKLNVAGDLDLGLAERLDDAEKANEGRVLLQADEVVQQRWDDAAHGLREDDEAQGLPVREPERARGRRLARVHGLDPAR